MKGTFRTFFNGDAVPLREIPIHHGEAFFQTIIDACGNGWRVSSYFAMPGPDSLQLICILTYKSDGLITAFMTRVAETFPSITSYCPQVHLFEREIAEQWGIIPEGHPWLKPVRFQKSYRKDYDAWQRDVSEPILPGIQDFFHVSGEGVHEVAVGPVHAGIIEPGHFRFQCHGERVFHLEIALGYQHRGIEKGLTGGPSARTIHQLETAAGDTTVGHGEAYAMVVEALAGTRVPARGEAIRGVALELERLANHAGDLGAIAGDVAFLPTASFCGRIRGDFLNMSALLCGSRFSRGLIRPGGTGFDCAGTQNQELLKRLRTARDDMTGAVELLWLSPSVMSRLENTGTLSAEIAQEIGLVGPPIRACGLIRDVRKDHPYGMYRMSHLPAVTVQSGDVYGRTLVRWLEAQKSMDFVEEQLQQLPGGPHHVPVGSLAGEMLTVALTEGWRGEICHTAVTDATGRFSSYKIVDPSFHNWFGLALALRDGQISDFPLCNKSFNLSYCGFDL